MKKKLMIAGIIIVVACIAVVPALISNPTDTLIDVDPLKEFEPEETELSLSLDLDGLYYVDWWSGDHGGYRVYYQDTTYYESQQELLDMILYGLEGNYVYDSILDLRQSSGGGGNKLTLYDENDEILDAVRFNNWGELYVETETSSVYQVYIPVDTQFPTEEEFNEMYKELRENGKSLN